MATETNPKGAVFAGQSGGRRVDVKDACGQWEDT
jgi:hypothetical protein